METLVERATRLGVETHTVSEMLDVIENTRGAMGDLAMLTKRLAQALRKAAPDNELPAQALDYMSRTRIDGSPYRKVGAGGTAQAVAQNVFAFPATVTMTPEQALLSALEFTRTGNMQDVLVVGYDGDGRLVVRSSRMDRKEALWLSEQARRHALGDVA